MAKRFKEIAPGVSVIENIVILKCPAHGVREKGLFCNFCGARLVENPEEPKPPHLVKAEMHCPHCGFDLHRGHQQFCPGCGDMLEWSPLDKL